MKLNLKLKQQYISFDIFDTLLYRHVEKPTDIFKIVEKRLIDEYGDEFVGFYNKRIQAQNNTKVLKKREPSLDEIYSFIGYSKVDIEKAKKMELNTEKEQLYPNLLLKLYIKKLKELNKTIIITSDMYLSKDFLSKILIENDIQFDYFFVSSDTQYRKSDGTMFKYIYKKLGISPKNFVHIGDNYRSDFLMPRILGSKSIRYIKEPLLNNLNKLNLIIEENSQKNYYRELGFNCLGPLLYGFCKWINKKTNELELDDICFLARDGQIVSKAYEILFPEKNHNYILASRRSLTVPLLENVKSFKDIIKVVPYIKRKETIRYLLYKLGIEDEKIIKKIEKKFGKNISRKEILDEKGNEIFNEIKEYLKLNSKEEMENTIKYIDENISSGKIGLVDIGWYGTMQMSFDKICKYSNKKRKFYGLYVGLLNRNDNKNINAQGYIFDFRNNKINDSGIFGFIGLIELMFTANHGSAKKYKKDNDNNIYCELGENIGEYSEFVSEIQLGAINFIKIAKKYKIELTSEESFLNLRRLLIDPSYNECLILGNEKFYDVYFEKIIQYSSIKNIIINPKKELINFLKSNWKIGYLKMMGFKKPLKIYNFLNKIK